MSPLKFLAVSAAAVALATGAGAQTPEAAPGAAKSADNIRAHITFLASDLLQGREAGSVGFDIATVNSVRPARKMVRRPIKSPRRPASSSSPPNAIRYALTTQARLELENPRSSWIEGSATFTMVTSSTIISIPAHSTYSASQRERSL